MVSIHLACCKEPPEMVIATIDSLAAMDYPDFEVIVVDNNTPDPALWRPVKQHCQALGSRFRFFTLGKYPGFKAGALNYALSVTDPRAEVVGVVDADYIVEKNWLTATVPYFAESNVALVQCPQEHRGWEQNRFQTMENDEYSGFFRIGMVQRNEENAIIQHGTMTLIRRGELQEVNGWAEWCICEDAELGLRLLCRNRKSVYVNHPLGRGLVPDSYEAYSKQRFRWAFGGMRIVRHHWRVLFGFSPGLNASQRYHFVKGWLPWVGDALHMAFTAAALVWSAMLLIDPLQTEFPEPIFVYPALALVALRLSGTFWTYSTRVRIGRDRTLMAMIAGGSLTHSIAKAVFQGLLGPGKPFHRTPKMDNAPALVRSLVIAREEIFLCLALNLFAIGLLCEFGVVNDDAVLWAFALTTQSLPYLAAAMAAVISSMAPGRPRITPIRPAGEIEQGGLRVGA
jgi:cellulose synthase/poly-beta-1,6-N-acetylglucosamine synthase-like glycosyltransferase